MSTPERDALAAEAKRLADNMTGSHVVDGLGYYRKNLRELLTMDERGEAINAVRGMLENMAAANSAQAGEGEKR